MRIQNGKMYILQWLNEQEIDLTFDQRLYIKLWFVCFYDYEKNEIITSTPDWIIFEDEKQKYLLNEINKIKQKYNEIILEKYPYYTQNNMSARIIEINTFAKLENRDFTESELLEIQDWQYIFNWIKEKRLDCKNEIDALYL